MAGPVIVCHGEDCPRRLNRQYPMKPVDETYRHVTYQCQTCLNVRAVGKDKVGGTIGAGRREDQPALRVQGRGI